MQVQALEGSNPIRVKRKLPYGYQLIRELECFCEVCQETYSQIVFEDPSRIVGHYNTPCRCKTNYPQEDYVTRDDGSKIRRDIARLFKGCNLLEDEAHKNMRLDNYIADHPTQKKALSFLSKFKPGDKGVCLYGFAGRGKTHLAIGVARKLESEGQICLALKSIDMLNRLRKTYRSKDDADEIEVINLLKNVPVLVVDDIGTESPTGWVLEKLYEIIDFRSNRRTTIFTTNLEGDDFTKKLGPALVSRIYGAGYRLEVDGPDRRVQTDIWSELGTEVDIDASH
ncbi:MAG TPA: ATP-binding protein [Syntrophomonadaceae bacterium]|jgi:DNA replication protein DnaC|nr:ATP-binding protein [Syntrophomonadaceae bacterium]